MSIWTKEIPLRYVLGAAAIGLAGLGIYNQSNRDPESLTDILSSEASSFSTHFTKSMGASEARIDAFFNDLNQDICEITGQALKVIDNNSSRAQQVAGLQNLGYEQSDIDSMLNASPELMADVRAEQKLCL